MFNKEGIPFFIITIPFFSIIFIAFFGTSYYIKVTNEDLENQLHSYKTKYTIYKNHELLDYETFEKEKRANLKIEQEKFTKFMWVLTTTIIIFMILFTMLMMTIISDVIRKYKNEVKNKEKKLSNLNKNLACKVQKGIEEGKQKDKAILEQAKLARIGSMISMIAHQWRQPLTQLSGILMELETATRFKKVNDEHILNAIDKSDKMIEFMSNTIDDFRNFYKPDKKKEDFLLSSSCQKAISLIDASLYHLGINLNLEIKNDKNIHGYPTEFSQVILNMLSNAKDILVEKEIQEPRIDIIIDSKGTLGIVEIKDNAGGIDEKNFDLIFDPYFSTKDSSKGTGLGLYISKLIIEKNMGGELSVCNDEYGAVFKIKILG